MLSKKLAAIAAISLVTASSAAVAQTAQPLSVANARTGTPVAGASNLDDRNGVGIYIVGAVVLGLIIWGIIELTSDDDPDSP